MKYLSNTAAYNILLFSLIICVGLLAITAHEIGNLVIEWIKGKYYGHK